MKGKYLHTDPFVVILASRKRERSKAKKKDLATWELRCFRGLKILVWEHWKKTTFTKKNTVRILRSKLKMEFEWGEDMGEPKIKKVRGEKEEGEGLSQNNL